MTAGVRQLVLFHHDPLRSDTEVEELLAGAERVVATRGGRARCLAAREGAVLDV